MSIATLSALEQADFTVEQARALTRVLEEDHQHLATKDDIKSIKKDINSLENKMATKNDIRFLEAKLTGDMKSLEAKMAGDIKSLEAKMTGDIKAIEAEMTTKTELDKTTRYLTRWIVTGMFFNIGTLIVLLKYLFS